MPLNHAFKIAFSVAIAALALAFVPSHATIIAVTPDSLSEVGGFTHAANDDGVLPDAVFAKVEGMDGRSLIAHAGLVASSASGSDWTSEAGVDGHVARLLPDEAVEAEVVKIALAAVSGVAGMPRCGYDKSLCVAGSGHVLEDANDVLARMPPGAGGEVVHAGHAGSPLPVPSGTNTTIRSGASDKVPEPVLLALLALGLVGISTGIRKYIT